MSEKLITFADAGENLLDCAAFVAERIKSADGHAEALKEIVPRYLAKNMVDLAAGLADAVEDPFSRDWLLTQVAEKCAEINDDEYALQLIEAMEDAGNQLRAREKVALKKAEIGELEQAFQLAEELEHPDFIFAEVALQEVLRGDVADAEDTIKEIEFPLAKATALQNIALVFFKKEEKAKAVEFLEKAFKSANEIEFTEEKIRSFIEIGNNFLAVKENGKAIETFDQARQIAEELDNVHRDSLLADIALGFLHAGSLDLADRTLDIVGDKTQMVAALLSFAQYFWKQDEKEDALDALEEGYAILKSQKDLEIRDSRARYNLWTASAIIFAKFGKGERAIEIAAEIPEEQTQMSALQQVAEVFALLGKDDFAAQAVRAIAEDSYKMFSFIGMADAKNELGLTEEAKNYLDEACFQAGLVEQIRLRSSGLMAVANRFVLMGEKEKGREICTETLEIIPLIKDESLRAVALAQLADLFEKGNFELREGEKEILESMRRKAGQ